MVIAAVAFGGLFFLAFSTEVRLRRGGFRPSAVLPPKPPDAVIHPAGARRWTGGCRFGRLNATIPLAVLEADDHFARIFLNGLGRVMSIVVPGRRTEVWVRREDVTEVRRIGGLLGRGVVFASPAGTYDAAIFWGGEAVLDGLAERGWPVVRS